VPTKKRGRTLAMSAGWQTAIHRESMSGSLHESRCCSVSSTCSRLRERRGRAGRCAAAELVLLHLRDERASRHVEQLGRVALHAAGALERLAHAQDLELTLLVGERDEDRRWRRQARRLAVRPRDGDGTGRSALEARWQIREPDRGGIRVRVGDRVVERVAELGAFAGPADSRPSPRRYSVYRRRSLRQASRWGRRRPGPGRSRPPRRRGARRRTRSIRSGITRRTRTGRAS